MKEGWEYKTLEESCNIDYGTRVVQKKDNGSTYFVYGGGGATFMIDRYNREDCFIVSRFAMSPKCTRFVKGRFFLNDSGLSVSTNSGYLSQRFLDKALLANNDKIYSMGKGMAQRNLDMPSFKKLQIPIPPLPEQQKIVEELDLLSSIIEKKKEQLKELDNLAQSIFYDMFGDPVTNEIVSLSDVVEIKSSLVSPSELPYSEMLHVSPANIISGTGEIINCIRAKDENLISGKYTFSQGDILYSKIRPNLNKVAIPNFSGICSADMYPLSVKEKVNNVYLWRLLLSKDFLEYAIKHSGRARMPKLNREALFSYKFMFPPIGLQNQFASKIETIEQQKELVKQSIKEVETLFNSRMDYYFN